MPRTRTALLSALSRVTSGGRLIPQIDGLRFMAISAVAMYHLLGYVIDKSPITFAETRLESWLGSALNRGWFGVELFFVISGFVISLPFAMHYLAEGSAVSLKQYYLRRLTRLEPPYILCISLCFVLLMLVKHQSFQELLPHYLATVTYSHNILYGYKSTIAPVAWSLEIEIQFYLLAPIVARLFMLRRAANRRAAIVALIVALSLIQPLLNSGPLTVLGFAQYFLVGFLLADIYVTDWKLSPQAMPSMDWLGIASFAGLFFLTGAVSRVWYSPPTSAADLWFDPLFCALSCLGLFIWGCAAFRGPILRRVLSQPWLVVIGGMCYTIYLYHELVYSFIGRMAVHVHATQLLWVNYWIAWVLMVPLMLATTAIFFVLFEKPFMQRHWPKRLRERWLARISRHRDDPSTMSP